MLAFHLNENIDVASRKHAFIDKSVSWMTSYFSIGKNCSVCDFGCGPGLYTSQLAQRGATVTGVDFSKNSIEYAQKYAAQHGLEIEYANQNYLHYQSDKKYDLITMIMCDFCALSPEQRKNLLNTFHTLLKDDGCILLDVYSLHGFAARTEIASYEHNHMNGFWSKNDYYCFFNIFKYDDEKVTLDKYTIIEENTSNTTVYNWLQYFSQTALTNELNACGFDIQAFFDDVSGTPYSGTHTEFAIVAVKQ